MTVQYELYSDTYMPAQNCVRHVEYTLRATEEIDYNQHLVATHPHDGRLYLRNLLEYSP